MLKLDKFLIINSINHEFTFILISYFLILFLSVFCSIFLHQNKNWSKQNLFRYTDTHTEKKITENILGINQFFCLSVTEKTKKKKYVLLYSYKNGQLKKLLFIMFKNPIQFLLLVLPFLLLLCLLWTQYMSYSILL